VLPAHDDVLATVGAAQGVALDAVMGLELGNDLDLDAHVALNHYAIPHIEIQQLLEQRASVATQGFNVHDDQR